MGCLEAYGAEAWVSDIVEWIWYTNSEHFRKLKLTGRIWTAEALGAWVRKRVQQRGRPDTVVRVFFFSSITPFYEPGLPSEKTFIYLARIGNTYACRRAEIGQSPEPGATRPFHGFGAAERKKARSAFTPRA